MPFKFFPLIALLVFMSLGCEKTEHQSSSKSNFQPILTENTLDQWSGKPSHWRFEDSVLIGEITPDNILIENTYFIWEGETGPNFELKADFRISETGNSGINYKSELLEGEEHILRGYQADIDGANKYTGNIHDEKGRATLAKRGEIVYVSNDNSATKIATTGVKESLASGIDTVNNDWNQYHIIANENTILHLINGQIMSILIDEGKSKTTGNRLGFQLHFGPPMKVEFQNIQLKKL